LKARIKIEHTQWNIMIHARQCFDKWESGRVREREGGTERLRGIYSVLGSNKTVHIPAQAQSAL
jgi:hypothetical protein